MPNDTSVQNEWNGWQIPHVGVPEPDRDAYARTDVTTTIRRSLDMKLANFGSLWVGPRRTDDYTRTELFFKDKDNLSDIAVITEDTGVGQNVGLRGTNVEHNPWIWGSTVKKVRDDQFFRMTMDNNLYGAGVEKPTFDVMDTNVVNAAGMDRQKNYPTEGWRSFGGKYDFLPYSGVLGKPKGNSRA